MIRKANFMTKSKYNTTLDVLAWIAFFIVLLYFFFRILGLLHSPITVDLIALMSGAFFVGRYAQKIDLCFRDVEDIKQDLRVLDRGCPVFTKQGTKAR